MTPYIFKRLISEKSDLFYLVDSVHLLIHAEATMCPVMADVLNTSPRLKAIFMSWVLESDVPDDYRTVPTSSFRKLSLRDIVQIGRQDLPARDRE